MQNRFLFSVSLLRRLHPLVDRLSHTPVQGVALVDRQGGICADKVLQGNEQENHRKRDAGEARAQVISPQKQQQTEWTAHHQKESAIK